MQEELYGAVSEEIFEEVKCKKNFKKKPKKIYVLNYNSWVQFRKMSTCEVVKFVEIYSTTGSCIYDVLKLRGSKCSDRCDEGVRNRRTGIAPSRCSAAGCRAHPKYERCSYALSSRHPWLSGGLFEHRVQTLLISYRTLRTTKLQTYVYCMNPMAEYIRHISTSLRKKQA